MDYKHESPQASFSVSNKITVREQLAYFSASAAFDRPLFERYWLAAIPLIRDWQCELMPDIRADLEKIDNPQVTQVIIWAGLEVKKHLDRLGEVPKN